VTRGADALRDRIVGHFHQDPPKTLGVAVSGGSDSLALLHLLHDWSRDGGPALRAVTVDHGLRADAAAEAEAVVRCCAALGVTHEILRWNGWDGQGNLQDKARRVRYALMSDWAVANGIELVALGHTADDQAETFLMRLAREAGLDGLSAMSERWRVGQTFFCRPALSVTRKDLREYLRSRGVDWIEDPSNRDDTFDRVRARKALAVLADLGISARGLSNVAHHLADVRRTLYSIVHAAAKDCVGVQSGDILIAHEKLLDLQGEVARRLLQAALNWVSGAGYAPRGSAMEHLQAAVRDGRDMTLHGCRVLFGGDEVRITREEHAVIDERARPGEIWDGRWRLTGPEGEPAEIAALGEAGLAACPVRPAGGLPAVSLRAGPAVWREGELVAAPLAGHANGWHAELLRDEGQFFAALLSH